MRRDSGRKPRTITAMNTPPRYRAPAWLPGGNLQTLYPALLAPRPRVSYRRQRWDTPDGDFIDLDWTENQDSGLRISGSAATAAGAVSRTRRQFEQPLRPRADARRRRATWLAGRGGAFPRLQRRDSTGCRALTIPATAPKSTGSCAGCTHYTPMARCSRSASRSAATPCSNGWGNRRPPRMPWCNALRQSPRRWTCMPRGVHWSKASTWSTPTISWRR